LPYKQTQEDVRRAAEQHLYLAVAGDLAMESQTISVYANSTVVNAPDVEMRGRWLGEDSGFLGQELLLNYRTENTRLGVQLGVGKFLAPDAALAAAHADLGEDIEGSIALPEPKKLRQRLSAVADSRRSVREFAGGSIALQDLATVLGFAQGTSGEVPVGHPLDPDATIKVRRYPSGGGLYPIGVHVLAFDVEGLAPDVYEYLPYSHRLRPLNTGLGAEGLRALCVSPNFDVETTSCAFGYVYDLYANSRKYGDCGLIFALIELGALLQTVHLAITALGLGACDQGGYPKAALESAFGLDGMVKHFVHLTVLGRAA
jgi:SagB-type dehydrogenase family enzyme